MRKIASFDPVYNRYINRNYKIFLREIYFFVLVKNSLSLVADTKRKMKAVNRLPTYRREKEKSLYRYDFISRHG